MIGNLLLAIGLTFTIGCGLTHDEPQQAINPVNSEVYYSKVYHTNVDTYGTLTGSFSFLPYNSQMKSGFIQYNVNSAISSYTFAPTERDYQSLGFYYDYLDEDGLTTNDLVVRINHFKYNNSFAFMRFSLPMNCDINMIEMHFRTNVKVGYGSFDSSMMSDYLTISPTKPTPIDNPSDNYFAFVDDSSFGAQFMQGNFIPEYTQYQDYIKFANFFIIVPLDFSTPTTSLVYFDMTFCNMQGEGSYQVGYDTGYDNGYELGYEDGNYKGLADGYMNGYRQGLATAESPNSGFLGLFNSLADTPIRYIRSLFAFEIFGMSALTIIMSLITGIIVIHVIKKVI